MKKLLLSLTTLFLLTSIAIGQESPDKALSKAGRALGSYNLDPGNNGDKLKEALDLIEIAAASDETNGKFKTWNTRGEIYTALADKDINLMALGQVDSTFTLSHPEAGITAAESYAKAYELAEKKFEKKDALKGLSEISGKLSMVGNFQIQTADYASAYNSLNAVSMVNDVVTAAEEDPVIAPEDMNNHMFVLAYCAQASGNKADAKAIYKKLYDAGSEEESVYSAYANMLLADKENEAALEVLKKGGEKFPSSTEILFAKINYYIGQGDQAALKTMLEEAIEKEPNNPSVHSALGNVYMQLFTEEYGKDRASETAETYFNESKKYFTNAVNLDSDAFDAVYSVGSLYFNRAAEDLKYASTLSIKQQKEYDAAVASATSLMEQALPFFQKAESMNANDMNTLIALKEIYARMNEFEKSKEFDKRLETVRNGESNPSSYFDK
jgi:Flp pilus assembly protein TadD